MAYLPVETIIREQQQDYYRMLGAADQAADSTVFIEFMLGALAQALQTGIASSLPPNLSAENDGTMSVKPLSVPAQALLLALQQTPTLTIPELSAHIGSSERTVERHLQKLQQQGLLRRVGAKKGGYWQVLDTK